MTPAQAYDEIRPVMTEVMRLIGTAPLTPTDRAGLGMLVIGHIFGFCSNDVRAAVPELADAPLSEVAENFFAHVTAMLEGLEAQEGKPN